MISGQNSSCDRLWLASSLGWALSGRPRITIFSLATRTNPRFPILAALLVLVGALLSGAPRAVHAAESYGNCTGFITSLPAVIGSSGTWCLKQDLSTTITSGGAITINTGNVTLDCNNFKIDGLSAGADTRAYGILFKQLSLPVPHDITVRHCNVRGFYYGLITEPYGGVLIEDNLFDRNTSFGIAVGGDGTVWSSGSIVRNNRVFNTGGTTTNTGANGIVVQNGTIDVLDNTVSGVADSSSNGYAIGINVYNDNGGNVSGNRLRNLHGNGNGQAYGILDASYHLTLRANDLTGDPSSNGVGISCPDEGSRAKDNVISGFAIAMAVCGDAGGNDITP